MYQLRRSPSFWNSLIASPIVPTRSLWDLQPVTKKKNLLLDIAVSLQLTEEIGWLALMYGVPDEIDISPYVVVQKLLIYSTPAVTTGEGTGFAGHTREK